MTYPFLAKTLVPTWDSLLAVVSRSSGTRTTSSSRLGNEPAAAVSSAAFFLLALVLYAVTASTPTLGVHKYRMEPRPHLPDRHHRECSAQFHRAYTLNSFLVILKGSQYSILIFSNNAGSDLILSIPSKYSTIQRRPTLLCQYANAYEKSLGGIKSWALGGESENYFPLLIAQCRTAARRTRLDELLFVVIVNARQMYITRSIIFWIR
jgi:hypothetical protein